MIRTPLGAPYAVEYTIDLTGTIFGDSQSDLKSNIQDLVDAYSVDKRDFALYWTDGTATPDIAISNSDCLGGVQVTRRPVLDMRHDGQYTSYWDYSVGLKATVILNYALARNFIYDFSETIEIVGTGGPKRVWVQLKRQRAQRQQTRPYTLCQATQSGFIVGLNGYIDNLIPGARWPDLLDSEGFRFSRVSPRIVNGDYMEYRTNYSYTFTNNGPFPGSSLPGNV